MKNKIDYARAFYYGFFSKLFTFTDDKNRFNGVKEAAEILYENALDPNSKEALNHFINNFDEQKVSDEFDYIFYDLANDPVPTTASFYDEEIENGKMRLKMIDLVLASKFRKNEKFTDTEDDIGFILPFMQHLILEKLRDDEKSEWLEEKTFEILNEFVDDFIENVYMHSAADLYKDIAIVLKSFIETERIYFEKSKPKKEKITKTTQTTIADEEALRRKLNKQKKTEEVIMSCNLEEGGDVEDNV